MGKSAPKAPDPVKTADTQTKSNIATAVAQQNLNQVDQTTPGGSVKYTVIGKNADGTPKYQATQTLSAPVQKVFDNATATAGTPVDLSNDATEARLMELGRSRLDPILAQRRQANETDLINRGIRPGSTNYGQAQDTQNQAENDAYNQLLLQGRQQSVSEALAAHNSPINDYAALAGTGTQIATPQTGVAGTDVAGIATNNYNTQSQQYQQQQSDMYGGLFGLGKAAIGLFSDKRLKTDIRSTGEELAGVPVKSWKWKGTGERDMGVIAQDVARKHPAMVDRSDPSGFMKVNYQGLMKLGKMGRAA